MPKITGFDEITPFTHKDYIYLLNRVGIVSNQIPILKHDLIECSVCHKLIEEPNIDMCEFCDEDVCDNCWDKHQCEQEFANYE